MRLFSTLILTLLLSLTLVQSASAYTVESGHPRVYFNAASKATFVSKCNSAMSTLYGEFKTWVDGNIIGASYPLGSTEAYKGHMKHLGGCHMVEGPADTTYYHQMKLMMTHIYAQANWEQDNEYLFTLAIFFDEANAELVTGGLEARHGDSLGVALAYHTANYQTWYTTNNAHTKLSRLRELVAGGLALHGEGYNDAAATAACDTFYNTVFGAPHAIAMIDSIARDGGYFQGDYNRIVLNEFTEALWMFDCGTTDVAPFDSTSCLEGWGDYILWDTWCDSKAAMVESYAFGSGKQAFSVRHAGGRFALRLLVNMLASAYQDPNAMWLEDQFAIHASYLQNHDKRNYIAFHDTLLAGISPVTAGWPEAIEYDVGTVFMRDGWNLDNLSEDIWAVYRHEQYPFGHAHGDVGHFIIARGQDLLLLDAGLRETGVSTHIYNYYMQSIAHNTILIKDFSESAPMGTENTGGQDYTGDAHPITVSAYTDSMITGNDGRGSITDFTVVTDTLVYIRSDMTDAYSSAKVDTVRREFAWLETKDTFLIFDTVKLDSTGFLQKQLFHMIPNPTTLTSAARWTEGDSTVKLTSLFGTGDVTITEVGGTGAHFMCNGTNYTDALETPGEYDEGDYRLELSPGRSTDHRWMLTAIQVTAQADTSYSTLALIESGDYIGAAVDSDTILFHKYGGTYATGGQGAGNGNGNGGDAATGRRPIALGFTRRGGRR